MNKLSTRTWLSFILIGIVGQFAWTIENMYFNVYLYNTISTDPSYIAAMVAASAVIATFTTLVMGALSDRIGKRKLLISTGYILWGLSTMAFGFISIKNISVLFPAANAVAMAAVFLIIMDCIMTFFGSTANDAAFNAYVTDMTNNNNRAKAESVLQILPLISMLIIFGAFDSMTQQGKWQEFFMIFGVMITAVGILSLILLKEPVLEKKSGSFSSNLIFGFKPLVIRENRKLYMALSALGLFSVSVQVFFPYFIIYLQNYLKIDAYALVLGIVMIVASIVSVISGRFIDKLGKLKFSLPATGLMFTGLIGLYFARTMLITILFGIVMMSGYMLVVASLSALVRDFTPRDQVGHFQGIRMIFAVMLPMLIGPFIGAMVIKNSNSTYIELGIVKNVPTPSIFLASAIILLLVLLPIIKLKRSATHEN
ncbi:MAG: MFS transporter [Clostridia bacterium]|nr:MFS transporter [Clostridia bacterium]